MWADHWSKQGLFKRGELSVEIKQVLSIVLLIAVISGCSSVISNSEDFYKNRPGEPISDSLLFRLHCCSD